MRLILFYFLLLCFVSLNGAVAGESAESLSANHIHDFGALKQGSQVSHTFAITNNGSTPVTIRDVNLSLPGMTARFKREIPPGEVGKITVNWNTSSVSGKVEGQAEVHLDDPAQSNLKFRLRALIKPSLEIAPTAVFFSIYNGESSEQRVRVVNNEDTPVRIVKLEADGDHFSADLRVAHPGKAYEIVVTVPSTTPAGRYLEAIYLHTDHSTFPRLRLPVNVLVKTDLYASPSTIDFGMIRLEQLKKNPKLLTEIVAIRKRHGDFRITSIESDLPMLEVLQSTQGASQIIRLDIGIVAEQVKPGKMSGELRIKTDDRDFPELIIPILADIE
jgi:Protein of unknown function (DUF1573)